MNGMFSMKQFTTAFASDFQLFLAPVRLHLVYIFCNIFIIIQEKLLPISAYFTIEQVFHEPLRAQQYHDGQRDINIL